MKTATFSKEETALSNELIGHLTEHAVKTALGLGIAMPPDVASSLICRVYMAAGISCLITMAKHTGGSVNHTAIRAMLESLLATQATKVERQPDGSLSPVTTH